jgi:hypothetical protein
MKPQVAALLRSPSKMYNRPVTIDGIRFSSKKEGQRYADLKLLESLGEIEDLETQKTFAMGMDGKNGQWVHLCVYRCDFYYRNSKGKREWVVEDVKGQKSGVPYDLFTLKKRLMLALYGVEVREI